MGELYDDSIFNKREDATRPSARRQNLLFFIAGFALGVALSAGVYLWWEYRLEKRVINVNAASAEELQYLPGVGPALAREIVKHRPYAAPEDLIKVPGIGDKTFQTMRPRVTTE